jgi:hypothetical protein
MLQLENTTPYEADRAVLLDLDGSEIWVVAVKATFELRGAQTIVAEQQEPVRSVDEHYGTPGLSSLKYEGELLFTKAGTDVVINGTAHAPGGRSVSKLDVTISIAGRRKVIRVYGDREWRGAFAGLTMSSPQPFEMMPLVYERAFGGTDASADDPARHAAEPRNPIGAGFAASRSNAKGRPLPNLEDPSDEISGWNSRPAPVGVGFVGRHWEPRRRYAGTCDQAYIETRLPLYPRDFDVRFFSGAPEDQVFTPHLRGGEPVHLENLSPYGPLVFTLPRVFLGFRTLLGGRWVDHQAKLGSVVIEPDASRLMLTWYTALPCHRKTFHLEETRIFEKTAIA